MAVKRASLIKLGFFQLRTVSGLFSLQVMTVMWPCWLCYVRTAAC